MAEDIKDEEIPQEGEQNSENIEQTQEESNEELIPEENDSFNEDLTEDMEQSSFEESLEKDETHDSTDSEVQTIQQDDEESEEVSQKEEEIEIVENEENPIQQKQSKLKKILMIAIGVLSGILFLGFILNLFGVFDPPKPKPVMVKAMDNNQTKEPEKYIFDAKDINMDRLNSKLKILTKYEIIGTAQEERQKELEKNSKLSTQQINDLLKKEQEKKEEAIKKAEEEKKKQEAMKKAEEEKKKQEAIKKAQEEKKKEERPYDLLKFIQVSTTSKESLSSINDELKKLKVKISSCKDNNREFLLIGSFKSNKDLNTIFRKIYNEISKSASKKDLARLEFNKICK